MKKNTLWTFILLVCLASVGFGATITLNETNLGNIGDVYVESLNADTNYGSAVILIANASDFAYTLWNLSVVPAGANITNGTLCVYQTNGTGSDTWQAWNTSLTNSSGNAWTESDLRWNTQPYGDTLQSTINSVENSYMCWDITSAVQATYSRVNKNMSILINDTTAGLETMVFNSKENSTNTPYLNVTYSYAPTYSNNASSNLTPNAGDSVVFSANWTAPSDSLDSYIFSWNASGSWVNDSVVSFSGSWSNITKTIPATAYNSPVGWYIWANNSLSMVNQTVTTTISVGTGGVLNITCYNESDTTQRIYFTAVISNSTYSNTYSNTYQVLDAPSSLPIGSITITISNSSFYSPRYYYTTFNKGDAKNMSVYLLPLSDPYGMTFTFYVMNNFGSSIVGAVVSISKLIGGTYQTVAQTTAGPDGGAVFNVDYQTQYNVVVTATGYASGGIVGWQPSPSQPTARLVLSSNMTQFGFQGIWSDVNYSLTPAQYIVYAVYDPMSETYNSTNPFPIAFSITSANSTLNEWGLNLTLQNGTQIYTYTNNTSMAGGSIGVDLDPTDKTEQYVNATAWFISRNYSNSVYTINHVFHIYNGVGVNASTTSLTGFFSGLGGGGFNSIGFSLVAKEIIALVVSLTVSGAYAKWGGNLGGSGVLFLIAFGIFGLGGWLHPYLLLADIIIGASFVIYKWF